MFSLKKRNPNELGIDQIKERAKELGHFTIPKGRVRQLRNFETSVKAMVAMLAEKCIRDAESHGISAKEWRNGIYSEVMFWQNCISDAITGDEAQEFLELFQLDREFEYKKYLNSNTLTTDIYVLDIGCSLRPAFGKIFNDSTINVIAADPLASAYNFLMDIHNIERGFSLEWGVAEKVADLFGENRFDFILSQNSIDHGINPEMAFTQIVTALKPGGIARIEFWKNEAEFQNYEGFHQWNIEVTSEKDIHIWHKNQNTLVNFAELNCSMEVRSIDRVKMDGNFRGFYVLEITKY